MLAITLPMLATRNAGVTLLELVIVLAILTLLAVMAVPSTIDRWQRETVTLLAERLASTISLAQRTAQHRHLQTEIAPRNASTGWSSGWELTVLETTSTPGAATASEREIMVSVPLPTVPAVRLSVPRGTLSYEAVGYSRMTEVTGTTVTISSGRHTRLVRINTVGRPRICDPDTDRSSSCRASNTDP
ncbi:GspH/FimT family pseudopilin [Ralstonia pickettii]|nr:GspH/FimT family pseudopilin [Ralstonia pickettii]